MTSFLRHVHCGQKSGHGVVGGSSSTGKPLEDKKLLTNATVVLVSPGGLGVLRLTRAKHKSVIDDVSRSPTG